VDHDPALRFNQKYLNLWSKRLQGWKNKLLTAFSFLVELTL